MTNNIDEKVVEGFGEEWSRFDQSVLSEHEQIEIFNAYFSIFPWQKLAKEAVGFDLGCGSGRWAKLVAPKVGQLHCIDPSLAALSVAKKNCAALNNCQFHLASVDKIPLEKESVDFGYSLGVLHHIPNTEEGIKSCVTKLKQGAPFLLYLYYSFENRPWWFKTIWKTSEISRFVISKSPFTVRYLLSQVIALIIYLPLAKSSLLLEQLGINVDSMPLSQYRRRSFYVMRTDALDRFGTRLEKRFSKAEISQMMQRAGLENIVFSDRAPYWCAVGYKK
ncbi:MAG TPA: class I SAM-dependent methyltransferase [Coleofasciculaceae cyanobacterium]|jgi:ubiquinone/menaquinone biosynthesis C-methylase UbiE